MKHSQKKQIIQTFAVHPEDTGSPQVQIAILTHRIQELTKHLEEHQKDNHSRRGLLVMVGKRRKLLNFLRMENKEEFEKLSEKLGLKRTNLS
jgi:small subunit ribosomal protein S15